MGVVAIVPMRHSSERVPGKNYRSFAGRPLYHRIVTALLGSEKVSQVVIDTDSEHIRDDAEEHFPQVRTVDRPAHLRAGDVPMNDVLLNTIGEVEADLYLQTHSTNPLLRSATIDRAIDTIERARPEHDSLFSVTRLQTRLWDSSGRPMNHEPGELLRTQDLDPVFEENSNLYLFDAETLRTRGNRIGRSPLMFEIDPAEAWDIDEELDFVIAEYLWDRREEIS